VFENIVLRWIFGPKRDDVTGEGRRLHNDELSLLIIKYYAGDKIENYEMGGQVARMAEGKVYKGF
jgi:hypothetical protein